MSILGKARKAYARFTRTPLSVDSVVGDLSNIQEDGTLWCSPLTKRYQSGALVGIVPVGIEATAETMHWGYVLESSEKIVRVRVTPFSVASHPLGPVGELDPDS